MRAASQEREDEQEAFGVTEYHLDHIAEPMPVIHQMRLRERLFLWALGAFILLMVWIFGRGAYLATRELIRWL